MTNRPSSSSKAGSPSGSGRRVAWRVANWRTLAFSTQQLRGSRSKPLDLRSPASTLSDIVAHHRLLARRAAPPMGGGEEMESPSTSSGRLWPGRRPTIRDGSARLSPFLKPMLDRTFAAWATRGETVGVPLTVVIPAGLTQGREPQLFALPGPGRPTRPGTGRPVRHLRPPGTRRIPDRPWDHHPNALGHRLIFAGVPRVADQDSRRVSRPDHRVPCTDENVALISERISYRDKKVRDVCENPTRVTRHRRGTAPFA